MYDLIKQLLILATAIIGLGMLIAPKYFVKKNVPKDGPMLKSRIAGLLIAIGSIGVFILNLYWNV